MVSFPTGKIYNSYLIETNDFESTKKDILAFAISQGFDKEVVLSGNHPDIQIIKRIDEKFKAKEIKDIIDTSYYSPSVADRKFYILYDAVNLEENSQNTLLKTLEEPAEFDTFFLVTSNASKLLDTIKSRCMFLKNDSKDDYKKILSIDFIDDAIRILANLKYESEADLMAFAERFNGREDLLHSLTNIYRYILRDAITYKKTLSKELVNVREKETEIISIANSFSFEELGALIDNLDILAKIKGYNIDKQVAVFNYLRGIHGEMFRNQV